EATVLGDLERERGRHRPAERPSSGHDALLVEARLPRRITMRGKRECAVLEGEPYEREPAHGLSGRFVATHDDESLGRGSDRTNPARRLARHRTVEKLLLLHVEHPLPGPIEEGRRAFEKVAR